MARLPSRFRLRRDTHPSQTMRPWALVLGWCVVAVAFLVESAKPVLRLQLDMATAPANGHVADQVFIDETVDGFGLATARSSRTE